MPAWVEGWAREKAAEARREGREKWARRLARYERGLERAARSEAKQRRVEAARMAAARDIGGGADSETEFLPDEAFTERALDEPGGAGGGDGGEGGMADRPGKRAASQLFGAGARAGRLAGGSGGGGGGDGREYEFSSAGNSSGSSSDSDWGDFIPGELTFGDPAPGGLDGMAAPEKPYRLYFCSRTHSQLAQFVDEFRKTSLAGSLKLASAASRKMLCINPRVNRKSRTAGHVNEACLDLKRAAAKAGRISPAGKRARTSSTASAAVGAAKRDAAGCPWHHVKSEAKLAKVVLMDPCDIEDLVSLGEKFATCPYYASRASLAEADVVVLPYLSLMHKATRESLGLDLHNAVVVVDEAHNLVDSLNAMHSAHMTLGSLKHAGRQLHGYFQRFKERFAPKTHFHVQVLLRTASAVCKHLGGLTGASEKARVWSVSDFLVETGLESVNTFELELFIKDSHLIDKVCSFWERVEAKHDAALAKSAAKPGQVEAVPSAQRGIHAAGSRGVPAGVPAEAKGTALYALSGFITSLTHRDADARIVVTRPDAETGTEGSIKYVLLNPQESFSEVVSQAHSVVLVGGTMKPLDDLKLQLVPQLANPDKCGAPDGLTEFSCGHIVPESNVLAIAISSGPSGRALSLTYAERSKAETLDEVGLSVCNLARVVPAGMVVFFPSYAYEEEALKRWGESGLLARLGQAKRVFREPRGADAVEALLDGYRKHVHGGKGAILSCVIGGKMSEGINFADDLCRMVVVVGMPYPNKADPELAARMAYLDSVSDSLAQARRQGDGAAGGLETAAAAAVPAATFRGKTYYESLCFKAVNQSIGRAIRHQNDYAAIVLLDERYVRSGVSAKLPGWLARSFRAAQGFGDAQGQVARFFKAMAAPSLAPASSACVRE